MRGIIFWHARNLFDVGKILKKLVPVSYEDGAFLDYATIHTVLYTVQCTAQRFIKALQKHKSLSAI
jgi:hypothetical protein